MVSVRILSAGIAAMGVLVGSAWAQVDEAAKALLARSAAAVSALESVSFQGNRRMEGVTGEGFDFSGEVRLIRDRSDARQSRYAGTGTAVQRTGPVKFNAYVAGGRVMTLKEDEKTYYDQIDQPRSRPGNQMKRYVTELIPEPYLEPGPFAKFLEAETISMGESVDVRGEACDVVVVSQPGVASAKIEIAISKADGLPRRVSKTIVAGAKGATSTVKEVWDVKVGQVKESDLAIAVPEGYARKEDPRAEATAQAPAPNRGKIEALPPGIKAPDFELTDMGGSPVKLADLESNVSVLAFWGTWNTLSTEALPALEELAAKGVKVVAISCREPDADALKSFFATPPKFTVLTGGEKIQKDYGVKGLPTFVVLAKDLRVVKSIHGYNRDTLMKTVEEAMK